MARSGVGFGSGYRVGGRNPQFGLLNADIPRNKGTAKERAVVLGCSLANGNNRSTFTARGVVLLRKRLLLLLLRSRNAPPCVASFLQLPHGRHHKAPPPPCAVTVLRSSALGRLRDDGEGDARELLTGTSRAAGSTAVRSRRARAAAGGGGGGGAPPISREPNRMPIMNG